MTGSKEEQIENGSRLGGGAERILLDKQGQRKRYSGKNERHDKKGLGGVREKKGVATRMGEGSLFQVGGRGAEDK